MITRSKGAMAIVGAVVGLALFVVTAGQLFAHTPAGTPTPSSGPAAETALSHEQMDQMMDVVHGAGTSQRMHEAMGPDADELMDQCLEMMNMMRDMQGMMGDGASGMIGGQDGGSSVQ